MWDGDHVPFAFTDDHRSTLEGTPRMLNDRLYLPLQAADMLAWSIRRKLDDIPDAFPEFDWVYGELEADLWGGLAYTGATWSKIKADLLKYRDS
jgi:hypothetical protein